jgi:ribonuclease HII
MAKVIRDSIMKQYHELYPQYNFAKNKGYGTKEHLQALADYGPSPIHRRSFNAGKHYLPLLEPR